MPVVTARPLGRPPARVPLFATRAILYVELLLFLVAISGAYAVSIVGALPGSELLLIPVLPFLLLSHGKRAFNRKYLWFYILIGGWMLGTLFADSYNEISLVPHLKGVARVAFIFLDFVALAILVDNQARRLIIFAFGVAVLMLLGAFALRDDIFMAWKFGGAQGLGILVTLVSSYFYARKRYPVCIVLALFLAALSVKYGFRSQVAIVFASTVLIIPLPDRATTRFRAGRRVADSPGNSLRTVIVLGLAGAAAYGANSVIHYAAERGVFDESTQAKFESQSKGDLGVLVGGRPETLVAMQAIRDNPIIGFGSFAPGEKYLELKQDIMYEHGYTETDNPEIEEDPVIPTHSHLTQAWVENGILGGMLWIYAFILTLRATLRVGSLHPDLAPVYAYMLVGFLWDILYTPFGSVNRMLAAFHILLAYSLLNDPVRKAFPSRAAAYPYNRRIIRPIAARGI
jgi:hypothetical protein